MDLKEYIASGIIEKYIFDNVSDQERQEVECLSQIYPEIKNEIDTIQNKPKLEKGQLKTKETIIPLNADKKKATLFRNLVAVCILVLVGLGSYTLFLRNDLIRTATDLSQTDNKLVESEANLAVQLVENTKINSSIDSLNNHIEFLLDEHTKKIQLQGTSDFSGNMATVFWNSGSYETYLNVKQLESTTAEQSYQLWGLVNGDPWDMGVFDSRSILTYDSLIKFASTPFADAFVITIEPVGGSETPTLENLIVIGNV